MKSRAFSVPLLVLVFGACVGACGGSSGGDGSGGAGSGGNAGSGAGGQAGKGTGGQAGGASGGQAGTGTGGTSVGGQAGTSVGGQAGTSAGGHAGTSAGGQAGTSAGGQAGTSAGGHAGGAAGGAAGGGGGAPGACNNLVNGAQVIDKNHHAEAPPVMTGGTIVDGTYFLTAMDKYNGETGTSTHQETWVFAGNTVQVVQQDGTHFSLTYTAANNILTYTITCPASQAGMTGMSPYTATATQLVTVNSDDANELHTFTKQ
jgi:hypothetical protein